MELQLESEQNATKRDVSTIEPLDAKLALLLIENPAATDQMVADLLGISRQTVNRRKNSPAVQKIIHDILAIPEREMRRLATKALARIEALLDDEDPKVRLAAAQAVTKLSAHLMGNQLDLGMW